MLQQLLIIAMLVYIKVVQWKAVVIAALDIIKTEGVIASQKIRPLVFTGIKDADAAIF